MIHSFENKSAVSVIDWLHTYTGQLEHRDYSKKTIQNKQAIIAKLGRALGSRTIRKITPVELNDFINEYVQQGKPCAAKSAYVLIRDIFREAWLAGLVQYSPALPLRPPKGRVKRSRLVLDEWRKIYKLSSVICRPYMPHALRLALVTGQRRGDISKMRRCDIFDGHLHIEQQKTGFKLALPLELHCPALDMTLGDAIAKCPGKDFLLSSSRQVMPWSLSMGFQLAREAAFPSEDRHWEHPPTFHEQRSLSERIYRESGIDTQRLLGHKSRFMTDRYNDDRGREWRRLIL
ncbi:tyrosine-type recombinase/integrase [Pluralibacter gergoviae]|uniref:tyrosine-type recombinase/integrase n=1 Tax=Pluralibacter gergoviae TaxID=61647 RepID=UPI0007DAC86A|nr:tyrosine-type recombinase/integrase [Pluralibacter gergoviae]SUB71807.1 Site-specific recombinase XerC [Pluralibacter gergoviae]HDS1113630.1 tyrosine-type recombinase/integrase [Pluralibacter gergoviae]